MNKTCKNVYSNKDFKKWMKIIIPLGTHIKAHDTKYEMECEMTHWNRLRLAFKMTKTQKLPGAPGPHPLVFGIWELAGPWTFKVLHMSLYLCFKETKDVPHVLLL